MTALSAIALNYFLATAFCFLSILTVLSAIAFNFLSALTALLAEIFGTRFFYLHQTFPQDLSETLKICWIFQLTVAYLNLLTYTEPVRFLTLLYKSTFKL